MARLESLTPEQVAKLAAYRDRWLKVGLSTEPTDRAATEAAVAEAYRAAKLEPPQIVIWLASPMAGCIGAALLTDISKRGPSAVKDQVRAQVWDQVGAQVRDQVGAQVRAQVGDQVWAQVGDQVWAQVWDQVGAQVRAQICQAAFGSHDAGWLAFYEFFWQETGLECVAPLRGLIDHARAGGWWWPFRGAAILTERPTSLHRDDRNRLHCETGPAIGYSDGWGVYAWHGTRVSREIVEHPEQITPGRIDSEPNAEVRRVMLERYGLGRYVLESGASVVHDDVDALGHPRRLLRKPMGWELPDLLMVHVKNSTLEPDGSRKDYVLAVHPELRPLLPDGSFGAPQKMTCHNAVASTFGLRGEAYAPEAET